MKFLVTCPFGLSSLLTSELKHLRYKPFGTFPTGTYVEGNEKTMMEINIWSRIANKVFLQVEEQTVTNFDELFDTVEKIDLKKYLYTDNISITVFSKDSKLFSMRSIQSISHKAILKGTDFGSAKGIAGKNNLDKDNENQQEFFVHIENDVMKFFINTSGRSLHNRGRREKAGTAPLKENIAAALVLLGSWNFKETFLDPCCGSGTLCIEAAMIAKNMAPGLNREFAFELFPEYSKAELDEIKEKAKGKIFEKEYDIQGSDIDGRMMDIARNNARLAGVSDCVKFSCKPLDNVRVSNITMVSNPPYGKRLDTEDLEELYSVLIRHYENGSTGGFLTSYPVDDLIANKKDWKTKQINNNGEMCVFWRKV